MRKSSYEYFDKYKSSKRIKTNPGIDDDVPVLWGRTLKEWLFSLGLFLFFSGVLNSPFIGLFLFFLVFFLSPFYRGRIDPALLVHLAWSLGKNKRFSDKNFVPTIFEYKKNFAIFGP